MTLQEQISSVILKPESETLEYEAVLPPSKIIAQIVCSFANKNGGLLILGVTEIGGLKVSGLSEDFRAMSITHKAIDLLSPKPNVDYGYVEYNDKKLFAIKTNKSKDTISVEGKVYSREGNKSILLNPTTNVFQEGGYSRVATISAKLDGLNINTTDSKHKLIEHYQGILKLIDNLKIILYPQSANISTSIKEGKILSRIIFSSIVDNFETYLSGILYEIYLAKPDTLKSEQMVKVEDVLNCSDIQEFIIFLANQKIGKLQKGSVKGFIKDNKQIKDLNAITPSSIVDIDKILQIRHLYSHRNGIVDEKFLKYFTTGFSIGDNHLMSIDDILDKLEYLSGIVDKIDNAAISKYSLSAL